MNGIRTVYIHKRIGWTGGFVVSITWGMCFFCNVTMRIKSTVFSLYFIEILGMVMYKGT